MRAATLMLLEDGKFNLDDSVAKHLPELKNVKVWTGGIQDAPPPRRPDAACVPRSRGAG